MNVVDTYAALTGATALATFGLFLFAWIKHRTRHGGLQFAQRVFLFGPMTFIPLMVTGSAAVLYLVGQSWWTGTVIFCGLPVAILWHLALIIVERPRMAYVVYAIVNLVLYYFCLIYWLLTIGDVVV
jgi:hypothetical protein